MAETARRLKINMKYKSTPCIWCGDALQLGEDGAVCEACDSAHHVRCWDEKNGCGKEGCPNAPLQVLDEPPPKPEKRLKPDEQNCPFCGDIVTGSYCFNCKQSTLEGPYEGKRTLAPSVKSALIYAGVGLFCCVGLNIYFGYQAFETAREGKIQIQENPKYSGNALATIAQILGVIEIGFGILGIFRLLFLMAGSGR